MALKKKFSVDVVARTTAGGEAHLKRTIMGHQVLLPITGGTLDLGGQTLTTSVLVVEDIWMNKN